MGNLVCNKAQKAQRQQRYTTNMKVNPIRNDKMLQMQHNNVQQDRKETFVTNIHFVFDVIYLTSETERYSNM